MHPWECIRRCTFPWQFVRGHMKVTSCNSGVWFIASAPLTHFFVGVLEPMPSSTTEGSRYKRQRAILCTLTLW